MKTPEKSFYTPINPQKYVGDPTKIIARSNLERRFFKIIDTNSSFKKWSSETFFVPYLSPIDGKMHRYFVDLFVEMSNGKKLIIEIKPDSQTRQPTPPKNKTGKSAKRFLNEMATWQINEAKWIYAHEWAKERGLEFMIITEKNIPKSII